jgi:hypothetical protein
LVGRPKQADTARPANSKMKAGSSRQARRGKERKISRTK